MDGNISFRRFGMAVGALVVLLLGGAVAFELELDQGWVDSLYRSIVTTSLTGLDSTPRTTAARVTTIVLVLAGVAILGYVAAAIVELIARDVLTGLWAERRRKQTIDALRDHFIICGYGRVGRRVAEEFRRSGIPYVVLDFSPGALAQAREAGELFVEGDGTEDQDLLKAGLERARGLVAAADDDASNLYISLSAKAARPDLLIVARASDEEAQKKLRLAGADRVVMPYAIAGRVMANLVAKPQVAAFLSGVTAPDGHDFQLEQIAVGGGCEAAGKTIGELRIHDRTGAYIVAVQTEGGDLEPRPSKDLTLREGDVVVGVGSSVEIRALEELFASRARLAR